MSRIDEALRRAAEQAGASPTAPNEASLDPIAGAEVTALASEPFPIEISERIRQRGESPVTPAPLPPAPAPAAEMRDRPVTQSIFERIDLRLAEKTVVDEAMSPVSREQYRRLAAVLHDAQANSGLRVLMIASAVPGEGKTLTAANLALTLSESYHDRVLLIDADLRRPTLHQVFRLSTASGLSEGVQGDANLVLRQVSPRLSILPAGRPTSDPMAALTSERMRALVSEAKENFQWVILDTPPLMLLPDAHLLSALVDGAILVIKANSTPHELVKRATEIIGRDRVTGVVLNQAQASVPGYGTYYAQSYYLQTPDKGELVKQQ
jgi:protein-tyrosine kinase